MKTPAIILVPVASVATCEATTSDTAVSIPKSEFHLTLQEPQESSVGPFVCATFLDEVRCPNRIFNFRKPLVVVIGKNDGWSHECPDLDIYGTGESADESFLDFATGFAVLWDGLVGEPDKSLTVDARILRDKLQSYVQDIEDVL